ncbi:hypothetical protein BC826DRAFT_227418 [Russula brevipes]|nr:hypothetical protein BC826DRAFT_227418 [Russula brevipes]
MGGGGCMGTGSKLMATPRSRSPKATSGTTTSSSRRRAQRLELRVIIAPPPIPPRRNQKPKTHFTPGKGAPCVPDRQLADELAETTRIAIDLWPRSHTDLRQLDVPAGCHVSLRTSPVHILQSNNPTHDSRIIRTVAKRVSDYEINSPNEIRVAAEESHQRRASGGSQTHFNHRPWPISPGLFFYISCLRLVDDSFSSLCQLDFAKAIARA